MLKLFVKMILGSWGLVILDWCNDHFFVILGIATIYFLLLILSRKNFCHINNALTNYLVEIARNDNITSKINMSLIPLPLDKIVQEQSFFPFISKQKSVALFLTSAESVQKMIEYPDLVNEAIKHIKQEFAEK